MLALLLAYADGGAATYLLVHRSANSIRGERTFGKTTIVQIIKSKERVHVHDTSSFFEALAVLTPLLAAEIVLRS